jgi:hypothetical protein
VFKVKFILASSLASPFLFSSIVDPSNLSLSPEVGKCGDEGKPIVEANPDHEISKIYLDFAKKIKTIYI